MMDERYWTGVGSRQTPQELRKVFADLAFYLGKRGWILRSGGAQGADSFFEEGAQDRRRVGGPSPDIFLPWKGFNGNSSPLYETDPRAFDIAKRLLGHWDTMSQAAKKLHARNVHQVLGRDLETPSSFLMCWTPGGRIQGGTATAIKLAVKHGIPVFNFGLFEEHGIVESVKLFYQFYDFHVVTDD